MITKVYNNLLKKNCSLQSTFLRREKLFIAIIHLLFIFVFFLPTFLKSKIPSNSDYVLHFAPWNSVYNIGDSEINPVLSDSVDAAFPNRSFFNNSIQKGDFPFWNPNVSTGTPFGFLLFTDTFSIANLTTLIAGVMWGRILYYILKLFLLGYFTYLYLRQIRLKIIPSYLGAVIVSFSSYVIAYLAMHVNDSVVFLPVLLYFGELFYTRRSPLYFFASSLSVTLILVSGFPSITFYSIIFAILYFTFRVLLNPNYPESISSRIKILFAFVCILVSGLLLAAFSLIPTAEFFNQIDISYRGGRGGWSLNPIFLWRLIVGNFCGNPIDGTWYCGMNFNETAIYSGILPIIFLPFSWIKNRHRKTAIFFGLIAALILLVSFGIGPWDILLKRLPIFSSNANYRMIALLPVCMGIVAAIGFQNLTLIAFKLKQIMILSTFFIGAALLLWILPLINPWDLESELRMITWHFQLTASIILLSGFLGIIYIGIKKQIFRQLISSIFILIAFFDLGYQHHDYNGASDPSNFFPQTPGISYIIEHQSEFERMLPISNRVMVPSFPLYYSINTLFGHWWTNQEYRETTKLIDPSLFKPNTMTQPIVSLDTLNIKSQLIDIYRIKHVVIQKNTTFLWEVSAGDQKDYNASINLSDLTTFSQSVVASRDAMLDYILIRIDRQTVSPIKINFMLRIDNQRVINGENLLTPSSHPGWFEIKFPEQQVHDGQEIRFDISTMYPEEEGHLYIVNFDIYPKGSFTVDKKSIEADLAFFLIDHDEEIKDKFNLVYSNEIEIYENAYLQETLPIVFITKLVDKNVCTNEIANTDLFSEVLITQPIEFQNINGLQPTENQAKILSYSNNRVQINAKMKQKGIIILSDSWFPGWISTVDGVPQKIIKANCNMRGLIVEPGNHLIEMRYKPTSISIGITISLITLFIMLSISFYINKRRLLTMLL